MNSIKNSLSGLASSLLFVAGFIRIAEQLDPVKQQARGCISQADNARSAEWCAPCGFVPKAS